jgi:hypothetical protein
MSKSEEQIEAHLAAFDRHKDDLLAILQKVCERRPKTEFSKIKAWGKLRLMALVYLDQEASIERRRMGVPAADRMKLLLQLGNALGEARCKIVDAMQHDIRGRLFLEWCEAHGSTDLTESLDALEFDFDKMVGTVVEGLAVLETAAIRAAEEERQSPGRPSGTSVLPHGFIVSLESVYRGITGKPAGAGPGPFARFVGKFLEALGRHTTEQSVIAAIKDARKREEKHPATSKWGRTFFDRIGRKIPPPSQ